MVDDRAVSRAAASRPIAVISLVCAMSGFAGLGYEMVWARLLAVSLGHELVAVLGVISALFAGLALGGLLLGPQIARSVRPARWYAGLELVIGLWALALVGLTPVVGALVPVLVPVDVSPLWQWSVAFALPFVLLSPATLAMGATVPALEAVLAPRLASGAAVGMVYAANTAGAVAGTLGTAFVVIPALGLSGTLVVCAGLNVLCAAVAWAQDQQVPAVAPLRRREGRFDRVLVPLFVTGLMGIGYEVLTVRVLSQILENTIYTFALLLAAYLTGTALGAAAANRWAGRDDSSVARLLLATVLACALGVALLGSADSLLAGLRNLLPASLAGRLGVELVMALLAFLLPTIAMGALFTVLAQRASDRLGGVGTALAANTLGGALAPAVFGPVLLPLLGAKWAFAVLILGYLLALPDLRRPARFAAGLTVAAVAALLLSPLTLRFVPIPAGGALLWHRDGVMAAVSVVRNSAGDLHLQVNNHFRMGGTASIRSDHRQAHIPLLLHPDPHRALFLGLGTGATLSAAGDHPGLVTDGVELVPEVVETFPLFAASAPHLQGNGKIRIHVADARRFVRAQGAPYDVIVADLYHPSVDGSGALYAREHFSAIRERLAAGGIFCQWLPLHQLDLPTLRTIMRTFLDVFPDASAYLAQFSVETPLIALVGRLDGQAYAPDWLRHRVRDPQLAERLKAVDLPDDLALFGLYLGGAAELKAFAGPGPVNTDDRPFVTAEAPRAAYASLDTPGARLLAVLQGLNPRPADLLGSQSGPMAARLAAYWQARDGYLETGVATLAAAGTRGPADIIAGVAPRLLQVVRTSPDFGPAYLPLLAMARQLAVTDPVSARRLLEALDKANPDRSEARGLLAALERGPRAGFRPPPPQ